MVTSCVANWFQQHCLQIALRIATYIITSGISVFGASVERTNLEIMSLLTSNIPGGITTHIAPSAMPTPRQLVWNSRRAMFTEDSAFFDIFPVSWATSRSLTSPIQCRSACLTTSTSWFSTSWRRMNGLASSMESGYLSLLTTTSHQNISHMRKFLHGIGRRWR